MIDLIDASPGVAVGFYGKLPSHGDFLRRRVSDAFVARWDEWLQQCISASRTALGGRWLDVYLTSPAWRFACAPGLIGEMPLLGLMVPSVDRVGRYFHLTLVAELPIDTPVISAAVNASPFFESAERLVVDTLAADTIDFDAFDASVMQLASDLESVTTRPPVILDPSAAMILDNGGHAGWQVRTGAAAQLAAVFQQLVSHRLRSLYDPLVLWWTDGSSIVEPSCLIGKGLPDPEAFAGLLDGSWDRRQWQPVAATIEANAGTGDTLVDDPTPPRYRSAAATDVGRVRPVNQDSFLERPDAGLCGLGGHSEGEVASRMVCDALADFTPDASFEAMIQQADARVHEVNDHLVRAATRADNAVVSGSTVVALLVRGTRCAVIWAGDSRAYRVRRGQLEQLTRDHSVLEESGEMTVGESVTAITRAVGGDATLDLDVYRDRVRAGDRFLLCSDGLTRTVSEDRILEWMQHEYISAAARGLVAACLEAGAPDNVTVIVIEAYVPGW
jgi:type VI secretion system protein ImpM